MAIKSVVCHKQAEEFIERVTEKLIAIVVRLFDPPLTEIQRLLNSIVTNHAAFCFFSASLFLWYAASRLSSSRVRKGLVAYQFVPCSTRAYFSSSIFLTCSVL